MNWSLAHLRLRLILAKFRRFANDGYDDRIKWNYEVLDLEEELSSLDCHPGSSFPRTVKRVAGFYTK